MPAGLFRCFHNPQNSDMDYSVFNVTMPFVVIAVVVVVVFVVVVVVAAAAAAVVVVVLRHASTLAGLRSIPTVEGYF